MNKYIKYLTFILLLSSKSASSEIVLQKGSVCRDCQGFTLAQKNTTWDLEDIAAEKNISTIDSIVSYILSDDNASHYVLERDIFLAQINITSKTLVGPWPLSRWPHLSIPKEIDASLRNYSIKNYKSRISYTTRKRNPGCLDQTPLRFGDIESDGNPELVLFLNGELIIFSPQYQRTVFAAFWETDDWEREFLKYNNKPNQHGTETIQYASKAIAHRWNVTDKAMRAYSKIYEGSFDGDNHADILVWQKVYESNTSTEAPGFKLLSNTFKHFERDLTAQATLPTGVTGEYLPQETTTPEQIQTWLSSSNLTWQSGYPSLSECTGQETQLIPEMHDPLLNDPEVLQ